MAVNLWLHKPTLPYVDIPVACLSWTFEFVGWVMSAGEGFDISVNIGVIVPTSRNTSNDETLWPLRAR